MGRSPAPTSRRPTSPMPRGGGTPDPTPRAPQRRCTGRRVAVADTQTIVITVEASGEVTPAPTPETDESPDDEEMTDG